MSNNKVLNDKVSNLSTYTSLNNKVSNLQNVKRKKRSKVTKRRITKCRITKCQITKCRIQQKVN